MNPTCATCGFENRKGRKFCGRCGAPLTVPVCLACGATNDQGERFCGECGAPLATTFPTTPAGRPQRPAPFEPEGERKQLTVLFADVQGSMDLQERLDAEAWAAIIGRVAQILAEGVRRFGGTVDKFTGDGIMALFGAPAAQEDHARRACHAAWHLTGAIAGYAAELRRSEGIDLHVRLGLNSGEVVVGGVGGDVRLDPTALGHTVGLARRMEAMADPDTTYLSEHTGRLVEGWFRLADLGPKQVKGAREPLRVFVLEGPAARPAALRGGQTLGAAPLVGRERELAVLEDALAAAAEGLAQLVGVVGEAGVGKSRLCEEFARSATFRGITVRRTTGVAHGQDIPLLPILALLRDYFSVSEADEPEQAREKITRRLLGLGSDLAEHLPLLLDFLEVPDPAAPVPRLAPEVRMRRIFEALHAVTERRSEREVLVLLAEDLHWFDPQSAAFLERLVESFPGSRTLVLVNFRPEFSASWMRHSYYRQLSLAPLRDEAVGQLLGGLLGVEVSLAPLLAFVLERTAGNPFFVEEVVRALVEDGTLAGGPDGYRLTRSLDQVQVPPSVQAVLAARIDRLPTECKAVLQTAAVIGRTFARAVLAAVTGEPEEVLEEVLRALAAAELLQETRHYPTTEYRFWHPLTQEVAYRTLLARRRAKLHAAVAEALTENEADRLDELAAVLAWHWERAERTLEAARWNLRAGEFAVRSDLAEAQRRWRAAASMLVDIEQTPESLEVATHAHTRLLQFGARTGIDPAEAEGLYVQGRALAERLDDIRPLEALVIMAGSVRFWRGDLQGALLRVQEAARLADRTKDPDLQTAAWFGLGFVRAYAAPPAEALAATEGVLAAADGDPERGAALLGYSALARTRQVRAGILARTGRLPDAAAEVEEALRLARPRTEIDTVAWALAVLPYLDWLRGEGNDALPAATEALRLAEDTGNVGALVLALEGIALAHLTAGMPSKAVRACERALTEARERRSGLFEEARLLVHLASARLAAGNVGRARSAADEAVTVARQRGTPTDECPALLARARARRAAGEPKDAVAADLGAALTLARHIGVLTYEPFIREELARVRGDDAELREARRLFTAIGATGHARRLEAEPVP